MRSGEPAPLSFRTAIDFIPSKLTCSSNIRPAQPCRWWGGGEGGGGQVAAEHLDTVASPPQVGEWEKGRGGKGVGQVGRDEEKMSLPFSDGQWEESRSSHALRRGGRWLTGPPQDVRSSTVRSDRLGFKPQNGPAGVMRNWTRGVAGSCGLNLSHEAEETERDRDRKRMEMMTVKVQAQGEGGGGGGGGGVPLAVGVWPSGGAALPPSSSRSRSQERRDGVISAMLWVDTCWFSWRDPSFLTPPSEGLGWLALRHSLTHRRLPMATGSHPRGNEDTWWAVEHCHGWAVSCEVMEEEQTDHESEGRGGAGRHGAARVTWGERKREGAGLCYDKAGREVCGKPQTPHPLPPLPPPLGTAGGTMEGGAGDICYELTAAAAAAEGVMKDACQRMCEGSVYLVTRASPSGREVFVPPHLPRAATTTTTTTTTTP
ncbi:hypothetical protein O3P69_008271 [Scylla paramamosain]|uniref:Uncharacterized protein n=1 Tax=Scylla paramamosain TaxID=85552 RepID=A0AAW0T1S4_SCYPA